MPFPPDLFVAKEAYKCRRSWRRTGRFLGKADVSFETLQSRGILVVRIGVGTATRYAALAMKNTLWIYTTAIEGLMAGIERLDGWYRGN